MKKVLSYILISFILLANLLAPISVGFDSKNNIQVQKNRVSAEDAVTISLNSKTDHDIGVEGEFKSSEKMDKITAYFYIGTSQDKLTQILNWDSGSVSTDTAGKVPIYTYHFGYTLTYYSVDGTTAKLVGGNTYYVAVRIAKILPDGKTREFIPGADSKILSAVVGIASKTAFAVSDKAKDSAQADWDTAHSNALKEGKTEEEATKIAQQVVLSKNYNNTPEQSSTMPACSLNPFWGSGTVVGCIAQAAYYVLFVPTSYLFALAGTFFDYTFAYSVNDTSYRSAFVVQGWGLVRDFCNMFFIFVMLYIAISTILNVHGFKTKETIINVVIIGLFINFSLFATQVIIDASNITARVFYNSDAIKITVKGQSDNTFANATDGGTIVAKEGEGGIISLSEALVNKINPQNIIINAGKANDIQKTTTSDSSVVKTENSATDNKNNMTAGTFILIVFLAVAVNVVGIIVFMSVGLIFVTRVIGLWLAMILAPLAFFTYIIPSWADTKIIGWKHWWSDTIKLAFLAPVFIFFMYIILKFLQANLIADPVNATTGLSFFVATIIPFAFIMILMMKAKSLASDMSGEMGQKITGGVAAAGGMMLGGAAMGTAFLGRQTVGAFMKGASTGDTAAQRLAAGDPTLNRMGRIRGRLQQVSGIDWAQRQVGDRLRANQHQISHAAHSRAELDTIAGTVAHGKKWDELNGDQRYEARRKLERDRVIRENSGNNGMALGTRKWESLTGAERDAIDGLVGVETVGPHRGQAIAGSDLAENRTITDTTLVRDARRKVGLGENIIQSTVGGSFDVRNISKIVAGDQDRGFNKFATGLTAAMAGSMRNVIKQSNINYGEGQKDFVKDLGHTITEALKSTVIKVDLSHVGEEHKEDKDGGHGGHH